MTLSEIPLEAYEYVVKGKPAIEWIMERYQVTRDKDSGIVNDDEGRFSDRQDLSE
jgi:predicted helicase